MLQEIDVQSVWQLDHVKKKIREDLKVTETLKGQQILFQETNCLVCRRQRSEGQQPARAGCGQLS